MIASLQRESSECANRIRASIYRDKNGILPKILWFLWLFLIFSGLLMNGMKILQLREINTLLKVNDYGV